MKKGHKKLLIFQIIIFFVLLLNSFFSNVLVKYNLPIFLVILLVLFKWLFGFEKDRHRYSKDGVYEVFIVVAIGFLAYYLSGLFVTFAKVNNYFTFEGLNNFVIPTFLTIILREILKYNMVCKSDGSKLLITTTTILFIIIDLVNFLTYHTFVSAYTTFVFFALNFLPAVCNNIVGTYILIKLGYKPNILWLLVINMYYYIIPIVPNYNDYVLSILRIVFPLVIGYRIFQFFEKDKLKNDNEVKKNNFLYFIPTTLVVCVLVYFSSGYFKYQSFAIGSGSMQPVIDVGDVVIVEKNNQIDVGDIVAYYYNDVIIIHRIIDIMEVDNEVYYYSKGDANDDKDNYSIKESNIIGKVKFNIPFLGLPAVWLSNL